MTDFESGGCYADRRRITFRPNDFVESFGEAFRLTQIINFEDVIGVNLKTGRAERLLIKNLRHIDDVDTEAYQSLRDMEDFSDAEWKEIEKRFISIQPLLEGLTRKEIEQYAEKIEIHFTTLYRWLKNYQTTGTITGLLPKKRGPSQGTLKIESRAESVMHEVINNYYLTSQKPSVSDTILVIKERCEAQNLAAPSGNTIRNRISQISEEKRLRHRNERGRARTKFEPTPGKYEADYPLQVIQIDHTPVDLILVSDDEHRLPIGRPYVTFAIDCYSRMIVGYHLSLYAPSTTSVAMCISQMINPKDQLLIQFKVDSSWPVWGNPEFLHLDNAGEFRSDTLRQSCLAYDINIDFRPVGKPNYGGHVESLMKTVMKKVHNLPGTTFSNIEERAEYDSDGNATLTFDEFERWLIIYITKFYHKKKHSSLGISPEDKWHEGIFGSNHSNGIGLPPKPSDPETVYRDFLPIERRTVQSNGVNINGLNYYEHVLRPFIHKFDNETNKKQRFIFRIDPRNIRQIWFYEPEQKQYFKIPLANPSIPHMSLWELEEAKKQIKEFGFTFTEEQLIETHREMQAIVEASVKKTRSARRKLAKSKINKEQATPESKTSPLPQPSQQQGLDDDLWDDDIPIFD
ncbi:transposase [Thiomicrospira aerophila AL3]|uniref:Transposase n=1 Tax=Thiomicrospira aerophila AL3 TaxID=717772 RepID=W0DU53_9GAMM|nr:Mu transposase C-terminal domain-containing protein [Thiomicrospira aerophila]AHF01977.1 transposase [Thiomicrospira aerophila AL3]